MKSKAAAFVLIAVSASVTFCQGKGSASIHQTPAKVYNVESNMTPPSLLPTSFADEVGAACNKKSQTTLTTNIQFIVDSEGRPRNLYFSEATGTELDRIALRIASADRFRPAMLEDQPVATWAVLETRFQVCAERKKVGGVKMESFHLMVPPIQTLKQGTQSATEAIFLDAGPDDSAHNGVFRVAGNVTAPVPIISPNAQYSDDARKKKLSGICLVSLIVDAQGMPQNPRITRKLDPSLDQNAVEAVSKYRFKPAMKGGLLPVPVMITIEVNFRLY